MISIALFTDIAYAALALLIAVLAFYLVLRLLGKIAKFIVSVIILVAVVAVLWFIFSDHGMAQGILPFLNNLKS